MTRMDANPRIGVTVLALPPVDIHGGGAALVHDQQRRSGTSTPFTGVQEGSQWQAAHGRQMVCAGS